MTSTRPWVGWILLALAAASFFVGVFPHSTEAVDPANGDKVNERRLGLWFSPSYIEVRRDSTARGGGAEMERELNWLSWSSLSICFALGLVATKFQVWRRIKKLEAFGFAVELHSPTESGPSKGSGAPLHSNPNEPKDLKNEIVDGTLGQSLLSGRPPSLLQCVQGSQTLILPESDKLAKHFFGLGTLLFIEFPANDKPVLLGYHRILNPGEAGSAARTGCSILFHTSFYFRVAKRKCPMDSWAALAAKNPQEASAQFTRLPSGTLVKLLNEYKWRIPDAEGACEPLGVITRDLRAQEGRRVYTQYVFRTTLRLPEATTAEEVKKNVATFATDLYVLPVGDVDPDFFLTSGPSPKTMDYLAVRAATTTTNWFSHEDAQFSRGFGLA